MIEYIENEDDVLLQYPPNFRVTGGYSFINRDIANAYGYPRGYLIHPPVFNVRFLVHFKNFFTHPSASTPVFPLCLLLDGCRVQADVERYVEPSSSTMLNLSLPGVSTVDFHKFFDGKNINIVVWMNVGMHLVRFFSCMYHLDIYGVCLAFC